MIIKFTQEKRGEVERIQREFKDKLSPTVILRSTAQAINSTLTRSVPKINKGIKKKYNISQKYLSRMASVKPKANSNKLWGGIHIRTNRLPVYYFKPKQKGSNISVTIRKGKTELILNSFVATMDSGHTSVYSRGHYDRGHKFIPGRERTKTNKIRITEITTASVLNMALSKEVGKEVIDFMEKDISARMHGILQNQVDKLAAR